MDQTPRRHERDFPGFRLRGVETNRLEGFSDAVFGFALTLIVVSLDVPKSFQDLLTAMRGFPAFAICFLFLAVIWNGHYKFCRRYGLEDGTARFLTCVLLFLVLFFVYPLKFLFSVSITVGGTAQPFPMSRADLSLLLLIYDFGFAAVYASLLLLYLHAYRLRDALDLSELERFDTRYQINRLIILVSVGLAAAALSRVAILLQWSSAIYIILFPVLRMFSVIHRRQRAQYLTLPVA